MEMEEPFTVVAHHLMPQYQGPSLCQILLLEEVLSTVEGSISQFFPKLTSPATRLVSRVVGCMSLAQPTFTCLRFSTTHQAILMGLFHCTTVMTKECFCPACTALNALNALLGNTGKTKQMIAAPQMYMWLLQLHAHSALLESTRMKWPSPAARTALPVSMGLRQGSTAHTAQGLAQRTPSAQGAAVQPHLCYQASFTAAH